MNQSPVVLREAERLRHLRLEQHLDEAQLEQQTAAIVHRAWTATGFLVLVEDMAALAYRIGFRHG